MLPYQKCVSSIFGYPLKLLQKLKQIQYQQEKDMTAINYVACILENLKKEW